MRWEKWAIIERGKDFSFDSARLENVDSRVGTRPEALSTVTSPANRETLKPYSRLKLDFPVSLSKTLWILFLVTRQRERRRIKIWAQISRKWNFKQGSRENQSHRRLSRLQHLIYLSVVRFETTSQEMTPFSRFDASKRKGWEQKG